jgi:hypothetical protein
MGDDMMNRRLDMTQVNKTMATNSIDNTHNEILTRMFAMLHQVALLLSIWFAWIR